MGIFKSKKFWVAVAGVVGEVLLYFLGIPLDTSMAIMAPLIAYILGQGIADASKAKP